MRGKGESIVTNGAVGVAVHTAWVLALALLASQSSFGIHASSRIEPGAKVYIEPMNGFEVFLEAALEKKRVPVEIVSDPHEADFVIVGTSESQKAGWAKVLVKGSVQSSEEASIVVKDAKTGEVVYAYAVNKANSWHGRQSSAEACAKHLKYDIEKGK